jgi:cellulose synthase/poly-beta-1,6-N-acetylglucosamine synthase-like glycosyltransferase
MVSDNAVVLFMVLIITLVYVLTISMISYGWLKTGYCRTGKIIASVKVSIIIPARNEEKNILHCLEGLIVQDYPSELIEILVVDDHSEDQTKRIAAGVSASLNKIKISVLSLKHTSGKKAAIQFAMEHATGTLILCTDADCSHPETWVSGMVGCFVDETPVFISGPVILNSNRSVFGCFQEIEFMSLVASGAGAIRINQPIMCNGANLGFSAEAYQRLNRNAIKPGISSGDDVFLMLSMKKVFGSGRIVFVKNKDAIVQSNAPETIRELTRQRLRWVSKSRTYRDPSLVFAAISVFLMNAVITVLAVSGIINMKFLWLSLALLILKTITEFPLLYSFTGFSGRKYLRYYIPLVQPLAILFTTFSAIAGNIVNIAWKGRKVNH